MPKITSAHLDVIERCIEVAEGLRPQTLARELLALLKSGEINRFICAVRTMRHHQKDYFKTRSKDALIASKQAEKEVDLMLAAAEGE